MARIACFHGRTGLLLSVVHPACSHACRNARMHPHAHYACRFMAVEEALRICETGRLDEPAPAAAKAPAEAAHTAAAAAPAAKPAPAADAGTADDGLAPAKACCPWDTVVWQRSIKATFETSHAARELLCRSAEHVPAAGNIANAMSICSL